MTAQDILQRLHGVSGGRGQWTARCPAHDDWHNSLSISTGQDGRVLLKCHAGCEVEAIAGALGLSVKDLFEDKTQRKDRPQIVATYTYPSGAQKKSATRIRHLHGDNQTAKADGFTTAVASPGAFT